MIKFLLESYENTVQVSTINQASGKLQITIAPDFLDDVRAVIEELKTRFPMQELDEDHTKSQGRY